MTDTLPAGVSFTGYTGLPAGVCAMLVPGTVTCSLGALDPGTSVEVVLQVAVDLSVPEGTSSRTRRRYVFDPGPERC